MLTVPNLISISRIFLVPLFLWLLLEKDDPAAAGWLLAFIGATDWVDGYIARRFDQTSTIGEFLDPMADRLAVAAAVIAGWVEGVLPDVFAALLVVREGIVGVGALGLAARGGGKLTVRYIGKVATLLIYAAVAGFYLGAGYEADWLTTLAWVLGVPGLVIYYFVLAQYAGDARAVLARRESTTVDGRMAE